MKTNKTIAVVIFGLFLCGSLQASINDSLSLSKKQMYEDFDEFVEIIQTHNAQQKVRKAVTGYDIAESLKKQRPKIESISSYYEFIHLMNEQLNRVLDIHSRMVYQNITEDPFFSYVLDMPNFDTSAISKISKGYRNYYLNSPHHGSFRLNPLLYNDGKYYFNGIHRIAFRQPKPGERDSFQFGTAEILSVNDKDVDHVVEIGAISPNKVRWDFKRGKYYTTANMTAPNNVCEVRDLKSKEKFRLNFDSVNIRMSGVSLDLDSFKALAEKVKAIGEVTEKVSYYDSLRVLYIYVKQMNTSNQTLISNIKEKGRGKQIDKVIIDVRGNWGGGDGAWYNILSAIIKDSLPINFKVALNYSSEVEKYLRKTKRFEHCLAEKIDIMDGDTMFTLASNFYLKADSNSLAYSGKIYILQDENVYSSGHSFTSYARHVPQLVSVGTPTGNMAGFGFDPWLFQLRHSKFTFMVEPAIDITDVQKPEDIFQDIPEILIYPTLEELIELKNYEIIGRIRSDEFLFNHDYLFRKILKLKQI